MVKDNILKVILKDQNKMQEVLEEDIDDISNRSIYAHDCKLPDEN